MMAPILRVIRREYAIDAEWAGGELYAKALAKRRALKEAEKSKKEQAQRQRKELERRTDETLKQLADLARPRRTLASSDFKQTMWYRLTYVTDDEVLRALANASPRRHPLGAITSLGVVKQLFRDMGFEETEERRERADNYVGSTARKLKTLAVARRVTQWKRRGVGVSRWSLSSDGVGLGGWVSCGNPNEAFDDSVLADFVATLEATAATTARVRDLVAHQGRPDASMSEKVRIAHALSRLTLRGLVRAQGTRPTRWALV